MTIHTTRSQTINLTMSVNDFSVNETMTNNSSILTKFFFSVIVFFVLINENLQNAQMQNFFFSKSIFKNDEKKYQRLKKIEKKTVRTQKMQCLKKRERQNWISFMILFIKNANVFTMNNVVDVDLNRQFRAKKYFDIIKFSVYMKKVIIKLKNFIWTCHNVFMIKFVIYKKHQFKINFAIFLLFIHVSSFEWIWFQYRLNLNIATKSINIWTKFCQFLKKQMNFSKFRIINVKAKLHAMK